MVKVLEGGRTLVGDFVVENMRTPHAHYGFGAKPVPAVDVSHLSTALWKMHNKLEKLYRSFDPSDSPSRAYRGHIVDIQAHVKTFLLNMKTNGLEEGLNALEKPAFLGACISLENYLGHAVQKIEGVRGAVREGMAALEKGRA
jgi:hypothetical protein